VDAKLLLAELQRRVDHCRERTQHLAGEECPRVAAIEWIEPLMGSGNWIPELVDLAGGRNLFGEVGQHSPYLSWEAVLKADPDVIIVMPCGFDRERTRQEMQQAMTTSPQWQQLRAVQSDRLYITDGNAYFNRPGPRLVDSLEILTEILHPHLFAVKHRETGWEQFHNLPYVDSRSS
jgi:iron complex transport system substrate-binding protein